MNIAVNRADLKIAAPGIFHSLAWQDSFDPFQCLPQTHRLLLSDAGMEPNFYDLRREVLLGADGGLYVPLIEPIMV
ncbi:hypothetical protein G7047_18950 [Diaphorobacter sp. HDW4A]|uniref:hypothetical protein n=1 Tax=Diaphorobacter sp. HDW4A TaxID=2714924 RepID=UPI00140C91E3|nr:hypothetical protein [Diaphorobacter sp. HDW4A]QIL78478.1 hypothetical protein G7047_18950 [Diaphorobacter sp. HDW4A]